MKKVNIGLDIGIASVGWSIFDIENKKIVDAGSRLFTEANTGNSCANRREQRGRRRVLRRKNLRKLDTLKLFVKYGFLENTDSFEKIPKQVDYLQIRKDALSKTTSIENLMLILYSYIKHRGSFNFKDDLSEIAKVSNTEINIENLEQKSPIEIQIKNFETFNKYRGLNTENSLIAHKWYLEEVTSILKMQVQEKVVTENFMEEFLKIFERKRHYADGPGWVDRLKTKKSTYGWKDQNEWYEKLSGFDTYDKTQKRAPKNSMTACLFNLLNDLNNLKIIDKPDGLSTEDKRTLIQNVIEHNGKTSKNITLTLIANHLNVDKKDISGYRIDKKNAAIFTEFEGINTIRKTLIKENLDFSFISLKNIDQMDDICEILTIFQTNESREEKLKELKLPFLTDAHCEKMAWISFSGTHSLSKKTMTEINASMWEENKNQMQLFSEKQIKPDYKMGKKVLNSKTVPILRKQIAEMYIPPVVKRALIESLKIIKEIDLRKDIEIDSIVIEMARESNSSEQKKFINEIQAKNKKTNETISETYNTDSEKLSNKEREKLLLFTEQGGKCIYSGKPILIDRLKFEENYCEVDHILPFSKSFDNSRANKVLVLREENQSKGQMTPYEYFRKIGRNWEQYKTHCYNVYLSQNLGKYGQIKYANAVFEENLDDPEVTKSFLNRNLNDTRYVTVEVKNYLNHFKYELGKKWKIKTINGRFTSFVRSSFLHLPKKDRNNYSHHAIDATVCAIAPIIDIGEKLTINKIEKKEGVLSSEQVLFQNEINLIKKDIMDFPYKFTRKVEKRTNVQLFDETIYSAKIDEDNTLFKIQKLDLLNENAKNLKKLFVDDPEKLFIYQSDPKTFEFLKKIYDAYTGKEDENNKTISNPFNYFVNVEKEEIYKQSNEKNPPIIRFLKYKGQNIKTYTDISHKYKKIKKNKKVILTTQNAVAWDLWYSKPLNTYKVIPITKNVATFASANSKEQINIDKTKYDLEKTKTKIDESYAFMVRLHKQNEIEFKYNNELQNYLIVGFDIGSNQFEFKPINHFESKRIKKSVNLMKEIKLLTSNSTRSKIKKINCF